MKVYTTRPTAGMLSTAWGKVPVLCAEGDELNHARRGAVMSTILFMAAMAAIIAQVHTSFTSDRKIFMCWRARVECAGAPHLAPRRRG